MQRNVASVEEYLQAIPAAQLPLVEHLRGLIRAAAPRAQEVIRWGMLSYDDDGMLCALAAQKRHVSLYMGAGDAMQSMAAELAGIDHGKGCLRFKKLDAVPTATIRKLLKRAAKSKERDCKSEG